jgi:hypothetical protein
MENSSVFYRIHQVDFIDEVLGTHRDRNGVSWCITHQPLQLPSTQEPATYTVVLEPVSTIAGRPVRELA